MVRSTWCAFRRGFNKVDFFQTKKSSMSSFFWVPSKTAKLCLPPIFYMYGRLAGNDKGEFEA